MAYNPFNIFRRNRRRLFAVLTVFIMIMFTLSFGANDFFERAAKWVGKSKGESICKIDGDTIKDSDLSRVRRGRVMANTFMTHAASYTTLTVKEYANQQQSKLSEDGKQMAGVANQAETWLTNPQFLNNPMFGNRPRQDIADADQFVKFMLENPNTKSEDRDAARAYRAARTAPAGCRRTANTSSSTPRTSRTATPSSSCCGRRRPTSSASITPPTTYSCC